MHIDITPCALLVVVNNETGVVDRFGTMPFDSEVTSEKNFRLKKIHITRTYNKLSIDFIKKRLFDYRVK